MPDKRVCQASCYEYLCYSGYKVHGSRLNAMKEGLYFFRQIPRSCGFLICQTVLHTKSKEHAMSLWKHEGNRDKIGFNREP